MILYVKAILKTHTPKCKVYRCVQLTIRHNWCKSLRFQTEPPSPLDTSVHGSHIPGQKALICWPLKTLKMMSSSIRHFLNIRIHVSFKSIWTKKYLLYESYLVVSLLALSLFPARRLQIWKIIVWKIRLPQRTMNLPIRVPTGPTTSLAPEHQRTTTWGCLMVRI